MLPVWDTRQATRQAAAHACPPLDLLACEQSMEPWWPARTRFAFANVRALQGDTRGRSRRRPKCSCPIHFSAKHPALFPLGHPQMTPMRGTLESPALRCLEGHSVGLLWLAKTSGQALAASSRPPPPDWARQSLLRGEGRNIWQGPKKGCEDGKNPPPKKRKHQTSQIRQACLRRFVQPCRRCTPCLHPKTDTNSVCPRTFLPPRS